MPTARPLAPGSRSAASARSRPSGATFERTTAYLGDDTGEVEATWFGRRFIDRRLREGQWIVISGKIRRRGFTTTLRQSDFQPDDGTALLHAGRIVPVYRLTAGLTAITLRRAIRQALDAVGVVYPEYLPPRALMGAASSKGENAGPGCGSTTPASMPIAAALENAHYPETSICPRRRPPPARVRRAARPSGRHGGQGQATAASRRRADRGSGGAPS